MSLWSDYKEDQQPAKRTGNAILCPECRGIIDKHVKVCPLCGAVFVKEGNAAGTEAGMVTKENIDAEGKRHVMTYMNFVPFYKRLWFMWFMLFCFWPIGLYLLWKYSLFSRNMKLLITIVFIGVTIISQFFGPKIIP